MSDRSKRMDGSGPELADAIDGLKSGNAPGMWRYKSAVRWDKPVCELSAIKIKELSRHKIHQMHDEQSWLSIRI